jgi:hypothetical protein
VNARRFAGRAALLPALALLPASLVAQGGAQIGQVTGLTGAEVRGLSFGSGLGVKTVTEIAVPFGLVWPASARLSFDLGGRYASVTRKDEAGGSATLAGLTDIQARAVYQIVPDVAVLSVAANLPTGKTKLTASQLLAAGAIASDMIPFPVSNFGSGFNVTTGLALAVPVGGWAVGVGGSYRQNSGFTLLADTTACPVNAGRASCSYKAGGEFRLRMGADRIVGQSRVSLGLTYSSFGEDEFGSSPIFQSGKRYIAEASWSFPVGNMGLAVYAWDLYRAPGSAPVNGSTTEKRNVLTFGGVASIQMGKNVLRPQIEYRGHTIGGASAGKLLSAGARFQMPIGERFALFPNLRFDTGSVVNPATAQSVSFTGWNLGVTLRASM